MDFVKKMGYVTSKSTPETLRKTDIFEHTMRPVVIIIMKAPPDFKGTAR